ncbi:MAG: type II toxin-antitoxin system VapC family toxin [Parcubacteria group bacterium]|jgi:predicted nucleic acid-binding protein
MRILDSNIWIAYLSKADNQHKKAKEIFENVDEKIVLPEYLLAEICSVLSLRVNKKTADKFLRFALDNNEIEIILSDNVFFVGTVSVFQEMKTNKLSFVDCSLLYLTKFYHVQTFDKALLREINKIT